MTRSPAGSGGGGREHAVPRAHRPRARRALRDRARWLDAGLELARRDGHAARQSIIHGQRAAIALARGALDDAQVEADLGLALSTAAIPCSPS